MKAFSGIKDAQVYTSGEKFAPGEYKVKIKNMILKDTQNAGLCVIVETTVLEQYSGEDQCVGRERTWICSLTKKAIALSNLKAFVSAFTGKVGDELDDEAEDILDMACEENALAGSVANLRVVARTSKEGNDYNAHHWSVV